MNEEKYDIAIIGCGITGASIAYELSKYRLSVLILESENDVAMKTTKANSGIIHAGYDPLPGSKMARLNVEGSKLIKYLAPQLRVHYKQIGSLVIGKTSADHAIINELFRRGTANGVEGMKILKTKYEVHEAEPNLAPDIDYALYCSSAGIVAPWELCLAFAETAVVNGAILKRNCKVTNITSLPDCFEVDTSDCKKIFAKYVFNAAGCHADDIYKLVLKDKTDDSFNISPVKGEYYLLDKSQGGLVNHVIFQTPTLAGKGVLVSPTVHGNLLVGPNASFEVKSKDDTSTAQENIDYVRTSAVNSVPGINFRENIRNFSGIRAAIKDTDDFLIEESKNVPGFFNFAGIKSPGLSCGPAFGKEAVRMLAAKGVELKKKDFFRYHRLPKFFKEMTEEEKIDKIEENSAFGQVICRCETVTEGEILESMHSPIPARTIDGVKRRTNAGMGRCQGGFCGPRVFDLIKSELGIPYNKICQDRDGSYVVVAKTKKEK